MTRYALVAVSLYVVLATCGCSTTPPTQDQTYFIANTSDKAFAASAQEKGAFDSKIQDITQSTALSDSDKILAKAKLKSLAYATHALTQFGADLNGAVTDDTKLHDVTYPWANGIVGGAGGLGIGTKIFTTYMGYVVGVWELVGISYDHFAIKHDLDTATGLQASTNDPIAALHDLLNKEHSDFTAMISATTPSAAHTAFLTWVDSADRATAAIATFFKATEPAG